MEKATNTPEPPLVSAVIPFYNVGNYAKACLASLAAQTFKRCEILCVDDGSTDGTPRILAKYADAIPASEYTESNTPGSPRRATATSSSPARGS